MTPPPVSEGSFQLTITSPCSAALLCHEHKIYHVEGPKEEAILNSSLPPYPLRGWREHGEEDGRGREESLISPARLATHLPTLLLLQMIMPSDGVGDDAQ